MRRGTLHAYLLVVALALTTGALASPPALSQIPDTRARTLAKGDLDLRSGLQGQRNLVVISFERSQSADADTWSEALRSVREDRSAVDGYVLLIMGELPRGLRLVIETAMRGQVANEAERQRFLLMYGDREAFLSDMGIDDTTSILVVLLDAGGQPLWQWRGPWTEEADASLEAALGPR